MREGMGAPRLLTGLLRVARPIWKNLEAVAHTLPYDYEVMGDTVDGKPLAREPWASIATPTLVVDGGKSRAVVPINDRLLAALQHRPPLEIFNLYLVDGESGEQRRWTPPPIIPVGYPDPWQPWLEEAPDLPPAEARDLQVDASLWLLHAGTVTRVDFGMPQSQAEYSLDPPPDADVRSTLDYRLLDGATVGDRDYLYVYDAANARILAFQRADGAFVRQWLAPTSGELAGLLDEMAGLVVTSVADGPPVADTLSITSG